MFCETIDEMHKGGREKTRKNLTNYMGYGMIITVSLQNII